MSALEILERTFRPIAIPDRAPLACQKCNPPKSGVYLLVAGDEIVYVGSSSDIEPRIFGHRTDRRSVNVMGRKAFDRALWLALPAAVLDAYEGAFIRSLRPRYNRNAPRWCGNDNEILEGFGLKPHQDEQANSFEWLTSRPEQARVQSPAAQRIRYWRTERNLSMAALAAAVGFSKAAIGQWEIGASTPAPDKIERIAVALGMSVAEFYGGAA